MNDQNTGWHLDKKVPLSLIFAMAVQAGAVIWAIADIKKDVEVLKVQVSTQGVRDTKQDQDMRDYLNMMRDQFTMLSAKLDRLIERGQR
jgi:hypothetical protein